MRVSNTSVIDLSNYNTKGFFGVESYPELKSLKEQIRTMGTNLDRNMLLMRGARNLERAGLVKRIESDRMTLLEELDILTDYFYIVRERCIREKEQKENEKQNKKWTVKQDKYRKDNEEV